MWFWYRNAYRGVPPPEWPQPGNAVALQLEADRPSEIRADGTDDVQLIVSVRGPDGRAFSNSPPVKMEIVSGPGEFPTGRTIEFAPGSDIAIRDGEAAIEMRSYQSGTIVVRALSVGLKPAELKIRATGGPDYVAGITPLAPERDYVQRREQPFAADSVVDLSLNRPTDSSSNREGHSSRFANDGDPGTFWQPASSGASFWQVDLEGRCSISEIKLVFTDSKGALYSLQLSEDGVHWKTIRDRLSARPSGEEDTESLPQGSTARFLRVASESTSGTSPLRLAEITVLGRPL